MNVVPSQPDSVLIDSTYIYPTLLLNYAIICDVDVPFWYTVNMMHENTWVSSMYQVVVDLDSSINSVSPTELISDEF